MGTRYTTHVVPTRVEGSPVNRHYFYATTPGGEPLVIGVVHETVFHGITAEFFHAHDPGRPEQLPGGKGTGKFGGITEARGALVAAHHTHHPQEATA